MPHLPLAVKWCFASWFEKQMILQRYIFGQMAKTFGLTALALTGVLSTCGGVYNLTTLENLTATQTLMLLAFIIPTCAAFTLPIAALFSATIIYGRMASDNEFTACRASGIGTFALFAPCVVLSCVSAIIGSSSTEPFSHAEEPP